MTDKQHTYSPREVNIDTDTANKKHRRGIFMKYHDILTAGETQDCMENKSQQVNNEWTHRKRSIKMVKINKQKLTN